MTHRICRAAAVLAWIGLAAASAPEPAHAATVNLTPADSIQAAIDVANAGDILLLAPGTYNEVIEIDGTPVTIASHFLTTGDPAFIAQTVLLGFGAFLGDPVLVRIKSATPDGTELIGLTLRDGVDGVRANARYTIRNSHVDACGDGLDFGNSSGGLVSDTLIENNREDGIDIDNSVDVTIERVTIRNNLDDGIEMRMTDGYVGPQLQLIVRDSEITGNAENAIQIVDGFTLTPRYIRIEGNVLGSSAFSGLGIMCCNDTIEDFQGAAVDERVEIVNNTFIDNDHGLTGGGNIVLVNNIFVGSTNIGLKNATSGAVVAHSLFFGNGTDWSNSDVDLATTTQGADPLLSPAWIPALGGPAVDTGTAFFETGGITILDLQPGDYSGTAPELGGRERVGVPIAVWALVALGSGLAAAGGRVAKQRGRIGRGSGSGASANAAPVLAKARSRHRDS